MYALYIRENPVLNQFSQIYRRIITYICRKIKMLAAPIIYLPRVMVMPMDVKAPRETINGLVGQQDLFRDK